MAPVMNQRGNWVRNIDFLLALIGGSVGFGNVWRFPYLCYKNGGGCFLIPYLICVIIAGVPLLILEITLGQYMSQGCLTAWKICPILQGIGYASTVLNFYFNTYYAVILSWGFMYLFYSFTKTLPWSHCNNDWNTAACYVGKKMIPYNVTLNGTQNITTKYYEANDTTTSINEFWQRKVLNMSSGLDEIGNINWQLALCLLLAWVVCYFCVWKGVKSSGKAVYFTATFPYILLTILLVRAVTLPGAMTGIRYYMIPDWSKLKQGKVWLEAATQVFFSYSIGQGVLIALGSYNKFNHNCYRDSIIFAFANSGTSFYSGFIIFAVLGFLADKQGANVADVAVSGPGLAFIAYPAAVAEMPLSTLWAILFFIALILLGLDSQFVGMEGWLTAVVDVFPQYIRRGYREEVFIALMCGVWFLVGLLMVTEGGIYVFLLFDYYSVSGSAILWVSLFQSIAIGWVYGPEKFYKNMEEMLGFRINPWLKWCWSVMTPLFCLAIFIFTLATYEPLLYNKTYYFPVWGEVIGWCLAMTSILCIPGYAIIQIIKAKGGIVERLRHLTTPITPTRPVELNDNAGELKLDLLSENM